MCVSSFILIIIIISLVILPRHKHDLFIDHIITSGHGAYSVVNAMYESHFDFMH